MQPQLRTSNKPPISSAHRGLCSVRRGRPGRKVQSVLALGGDTGQYATYLLRPESCSTQAYPTEDGRDANDGAHMTLSPRTRAPPRASPQSVIHTNAFPPIAMFMRSPFIHAAARIAAPAPRERRMWCRIRTDRTQERKKTPHNPRMGSLWEGLQTYDVAIAVFPTDERRREWLRTRRRVR